MTTTTPLPAPGRTEQPRLARTRVVALCACYALLSLWALALTAPGPVFAVVGDLPDPGLRYSGLAVGVFKLLTVGPALAVLLSRGGSVLAVRALLVGQVVWCAAELLAPQEPRPVTDLVLVYVVSGVIWVGPWLLLATRRRRLWCEPPVVRRLPAVIAVLACVPLVLWSVHDAGLPTSGPLAEGGSWLELRFDVTAVPLALLGALVLAATHDRRWWDALVGVSFAVVGLASLAHPHGYGAPGYAGAALLVVGVLVGATGWVSRRSADLAAPGAA